MSSPAASGTIVPGHCEDDENTGENKHHCGVIDDGSGRVFADNGMQYPAYNMATGQMNTETGGNACGLCTGNYYSKEDTVLRYYKCELCIAPASSATQYAAQNSVTKKRPDDEKGNDECVPTLLTTAAPHAAACAANDEACNDKWQTCKKTPNFEEAACAVKFQPYNDKNAPKKLLLLIGNSIQFGTGPMATQMFNHGNSYYKIQNIGADVSDRAYLAPNRGIDQYSAKLPVDQGGEPNDSSSQELRNRIDDETPDAIFFNAQSSEHLSLKRDNMYDKIVNWDAKQTSMWNILHTHLCSVREVLPQPCKREDRLKTQPLLLVNVLRHHLKDYSSVQAYRNSGDNHLDHREGCRFLGITCVPADEAAITAVAAKIATPTQLTRDDQGHYTFAGQYLNLAVAYTMLTGRSPVPLAGGKEAGISGKMACALRRTAWIAARGFIEHEKTLCRQFTDITKEASKDFQDRVNAGLPPVIEHKCGAYIEPHEDDDNIVCTPEYEKGGYVEEKKEKESDNTAMIIGIVVGVAVAAAVAAFFAYRAKNNQKSPKAVYTNLNGLNM